MESVSHCEKKIQEENGITEGGRCNEVDDEEERATAQRRKRGRDRLTGGRGRQ